VGRRTRSGKSVSWSFSHIKIDLAIDESVEIDCWRAHCAVH
jgi:hypothetical protein